MDEIALRLAALFDRELAQMAVDREPAEVIEWMENLKCEALGVIQPDD